MSKHTSYSNPFAALLMVLYAATLSMGILIIPNLIHAEDTPTLYDRLGGKEAITAVVDEFVNRLVADPRVKDGSPRPT